MELPRFRGRLSAWGEMIAREVSDAEDATALPAGLVSSMGSVGDAYDNAMAPAEYKRRWRDANAA